MVENISPQETVLSQILFASIYVFSTSIITKIEGILQNTVKHKNEVI